MALRPLASSSTNTMNAMELTKLNLAAISKKNLDNAKRNPNAQTRAWNYSNENFAENDTTNPVTEGRIRRYDCGQVTDGAAVIFLGQRRIRFRLL